MEAIPYRRVGNQRRIRVIDLNAYRGNGGGGRSCASTASSAAAAAAIEIVRAAVSGLGRDTPMVGFHLDTAGDPELRAA